MNCREVRDVVCAFIFDAHHGGRRMVQAEPHVDPRDARAGRGPVALASGPTIPHEFELMLSVVDRLKIREWCVSHIMWPRTLPFPERAPGLVRQPHHVASHSAFPRSSFLRSVLLGESEAVVHEHTTPLLKGKHWAFVVRTRPCDVHIVVSRPEGENYQEQSQDSEVIRRNKHLKHQILSISTPTCSKHHVHFITPTELRRRSPSLWCLHRQASRSISTQTCLFISSDAQPHTKPG